MKKRKFPEVKVDDEFQLAAFEMSATKTSFALEVEAPLVEWAQKIFVNPKLFQNTY